MKIQDSKKTILAVATGIVGLTLGLIAWVYPEVKTGIYAVSGLFIIMLGALAWLNQKSLKEAVKKRSFRYGVNAAVTVGLVFAILVVLNYLNANHFWRKDLTKNQVHSLSEQTVKILKDLKKDVKLTAFVKAQARDQLKALFENYQYHSSKLEYEFVDPDRDPARAKAADIKEYGTVIVSAGEKDTKVQDINEEKLTNALIKVLKEKKVLACFMEGHGEKSIDRSDGESYSQVKKDLAGQSYDSKTFNLLREGKIPDDCDILMVLGPTKAFFEKEINVIGNWLDNGGRALFMVDPPLKGGQDPNREIKELLSRWSIEVGSNIVLDPTSKLLGVNASVPIVGEYSKEHPVTKDFKITALFPLTSTVKIKSNPPGSLKTWWLAKSTPRSIVKSDFKELATGQVRVDQNKDTIGSQELLVAVEGNRTADKKSSKPARLVVFGSSHIASNAYARHGANMDLFLNLVSWLGNDESLISIRAKEEQSQLPSLGQAEGRFIQLFTMILTPGAMLLLALGVWIRRRKL